MTKKILTVFSASIVIIMAINGCKSPEKYRENADKTAYDIIHNAEKDLFNRESTFTIEKPEDALRRRLVEAQGLQYSHNGSLGSENLEKPEYWPEENYPPTPEKLDDLEKFNSTITITLKDTLMIAAKNSFNYQQEKEKVFAAALSLDLSENYFRTIYDAKTSHRLDADASKDDYEATRKVYQKDKDGNVLYNENNEPNIINQSYETGANVELSTSSSADLNFSRQLKNGATVTAGLAMNVVNLLNFGNTSSNGISADASISIPLLRGSGEHIILEDLTQKQRNLTYAIYNFERYKKDFSVRIANEFFNVLKDYNEIANSKANYDSVKLSAGKSRKLAETGRMSSVDRDQAVQQELNARNRWINSQQTYKSSLDSFKVTLGLPPDAKIELDKNELDKLVEYTGNSLDIILKPDLKTPIQFKDIPGPYELNEKLAIDLALNNRLDLKVSQGRVFDSQRQVIIRADQLRAEVTLNGSANYGGINDEHPILNDGRYQALLTIDLPLERTKERNEYRESYINLERSVRDLQELEDSIKLGIQNQLGNMQQVRTNLQIQSESIRLAENRVKSTKMLLDDGRAEMRDFLEAENDLLDAKNNITSSIVTYRITELQLQRDLGLLEIDNDGLWVEFDPLKYKDKTAESGIKSSTDA